MTLNDVVSQEIAMGNVDDNDREEENVSSTSHEEVRVAYDEEKGAGKAASHERA